MYISFLHVIWILQNSIIINTSESRHYFKNSISKQKYPKNILNVTF